MDTAAALNAQEDSAIVSDGSAIADMESGNF